MLRTEERQMSAVSRPLVTHTTAWLSLCMLLAACERKQEAAPVPVAPVAPAEAHVARLSKGAVTRSMVLAAQLLPDQQVTRYAKVSGYLQSIEVDKGSRVRAGAVLARIEVPELQAGRARQQAELKAAQAEYGRLEQSLKRSPD